MWKGVFMCFRTFHYNSKRREQSAEVERGYCGCFSSLVSVSYINTVGQYSQFVFKSASICTLSTIFGSGCVPLVGRQTGWPGVNSSVNTFLCLLLSSNVARAVKWMELTAAIMLPSETCVHVKAEFRRFLFHDFCYLKIIQQQHVTRNRPKPRLLKIFPFTHIYKLQTKHLSHLYIISAKQRLSVSYRGRYAWHVALSAFKNNLSLFPQTFPRHAIIPVIDPSGSAVPAACRLLWTRPASGKQLALRRLFQTRPDRHSPLDGAGTGAYLYLIFTLLYCAVS